MSKSNTASGGRSLLRPRLRFSLKTFLAVITACALLMGFTVSKVRRQEQTVAFLEKNGGQFAYDFQVISSSPATGRFIYYDSAKPMPGPDWLRDWMGEHYFISPIRLGIHRGKVSTQVVERLADLPSLESLYFRQSDLTEESLRSSLRQLQYLTIESSIHVEENKVVQDYSFLNRFPNLRVLSLQFSAFDDDDTAHLVDAGAMVRLDLGDTAIGDEGLRSMKLQDVVLLDLARTKVTDVGLSYLVRHQVLIFG